MRLDRLLESLDSYALVDQSAARGQRSTVCDPAEVEILSIELDSRKVVPGALFCCLPGANTDGHQFAVQAVARGARALLVEHAISDPALGSVPQVVVGEKSARKAMAHLARALFGDPAGALSLVGVTGTNGKTTVTHFVRDILEHCGYRAAVIGTLSGARTTPESPELQGLLAFERDRGTKVVAMEVSSHALVQSRVDGICFDVAVFTNLSRDHLDYHHTMERYFEAKASLFVPDRARHAVISIDDPWGVRLVQQARSHGVAVTEVSVNEAVDIECRPGMTTFKWKGMEIAMALTGAIQVRNAVLAASAALQLGIPHSSIAHALRHLGQVPGRFELVEQGAPFTVAVDYAHTPDALAASLASARNLAKDNRVIVVFGCGGERDQGKRPEMGRIASQLADVVVVTSDNSRSEDAGQIISAVLSGVVKTATVIVEEARDRAIALAVGQANPGDVVLVAGKGHEKTIDSGGMIKEFDDRIVAAQAVRVRLLGTEHGKTTATEATTQADQLNPDTPGRFSS